MGWGGVLAAGVQGWQQGTRMREDAADRKADREWREESRSRQRDQWAQEDSLKDGLREAALPAEIVESGGVKPDTMDNRDVGQPGEAPIAAATFNVAGTDYATRPEALAAQQAYNSPQAMAGRVASEYQKAGQPDKAFVTMEQQARMLKAAEDMKAKGVDETLRLFRSGNKDGTIAGIKKAGLFDIADGDITMAPREIDMPGVGKVNTYDITMPIRGADGKVTPQTINSHQASLAYLPYEKQLELQRKGTDSEARAENRAAQLDLKRQQVETAVELAAARIARLQAGGGGGGGGGGGSQRERRITTQAQMGNVNREIRELDANLKNLTSDPIQAKKNEPEIQELRLQRAQLVEQRNVLNEEFTDIARTSGSKSAGAGVKAPKMVGTSQGKVPQIADKAQYDKLPKGAKYQAPDGSVRTKN